MSDRAHTIIAFALAAAGGAILLYACNADALPKPSNPVQILRCK